MTRTRAVAIAGLAACVLLAGCTAASTSSLPSTSAPTGRTSNSRPTGATTPSSVAPSPHPTSPSSSARSTAPVVHQKLHDFRIADATFVGSHEWVLGGAKCLSGSGMCDAIEVSRNDGHTWHSAPAPKAKIGFPYRPPYCGHLCVDHLRFASPRVGYAWGDGVYGDSFFMTTDGGQRWRAEPGQVVALEASDGTVIRVTASYGCPPGCRYRVEVAPTGSTAWRTVKRTGGDGALLARAGATSYLLITGNPAGGANDATSTLFVSTDSGGHWTNRGEPCPQARGHQRGSVSTEVDSTDLTAAPNGSAAVLCRRRISGDNRFLATTTDAGATFRAASRKALGAAAVTGFGAASAAVILVAQADTFRSADGGDSFTRLAADGGSSPGDPPYIGFASGEVGHAITEDGRGLCTTTDGGATWSTRHFS